MAYHPPSFAPTPGQASLADLQRLLDPRLEWVHDKPIGPRQNQTLFNMLGVVWRVVEGVVTVRTARGSWEAGTGDWVVLQPGHRYQGFIDGTRIWSVGYRFNRSRGSSWFMGPDVVVLRQVPRLDAAGRRLVRLLEDATGESPLGSRSLAGFGGSLEDWMHIDAAFRSFLASLVSTVAGLGLPLVPVAHADERVRQALAMIARDPWAADGEIAALAKSLRLSRRRLEQLFAQHLGRGVAEERANRRLEMACELLTRRDLQIKQVAGRCRFQRASAFSTWFRRHAGMTPMRFRRGGPGAPG